MRKIKVGILGATGMVGQRLVSLLANHPWFEISVLAASSASAGKKYKDAVVSRWKIDVPMPESMKNMRVVDVFSDFDKYSHKVSLVFSALNLEKEKIRKLEDLLAFNGLAVVSNNSAHRWTPDVPMIIPEINHQHLNLIKIQKKNNGNNGFIVVKPNCSHQSFLPVIYALRAFEPLKLIVTTLQSISGSGKTFNDWPEMIDNVIPLIKDEEKKTEIEPLKILGQVKKGQVQNEQLPEISSTCIRVPVSNGHMASVSVKFKKNPSLNQIIKSINTFNSSVKTKGLPTAPFKFIHYFASEDRPQTRLDRDLEGGMAISCGRFRQDNLLDWKFIGLSHNTIRGAAGGSVLTAELLSREGYI